MEGRGKGEGRAFRTLVVAGRPRSGVDTAPPRPVRVALPGGDAPASGGVPPRPPDDTPSAAPDRGGRGSLGRRVPEDPALRLPPPPPFWVRPYTPPFLSLLTGGLAP